MLMTQLMFFSNYSLSWCLRASCALCRGVCYCLQSNMLSLSLSLRQAAGLAVEHGSHSTPHCSALPHCHSHHVVTSALSPLSSPPSHSPDSRSRHHHPSGQPPTCRSPGHLQPPGLNYFDFGQVCLCIFPGAVVSTRGELARL